MSKGSIALSKARLDEQLRKDAAKFGHHGLDQYIEAVRQRHNTAVDREYAATLLTNAGYPTTA